MFELAQQLMSIPSVTGGEKEVGLFLSKLLHERRYRVEKQFLIPNRFNVLAFAGTPRVVLCTHMDTVPPVLPVRADENFLYGRGACDTKGIIASMIKAAEALLAGGQRGFGLLFVVGEERNSAGAIHASKHGRGSCFIINGEPTENHLALGSKGALRYEIVASGRMAHSAYPHLGESAIEKLLDALARVRKIPMPQDGTLGASTMNIGTIRGGRAQMARRTTRDRCRAGLAAPPVSAQDSSIPVP